MDATDVSITLDGVAMDVFLLLAKLPGVPGLSGRIADDIIGLGEWYWKTEPLEVTVVGLVEEVGGGVGDP